MVNEDGSIITAGNWSHAPNAAHADTPPRPQPQPPLQSQVSEPFTTCLRGRCKHGRNESSFPRERVFIAFYLNSYIFNIYVVLCYSLVGQSS